MVLTVEMTDRHRYAIVGNDDDLLIYGLVYAEFDERQLALDIACTVAARNGLHVMYDPWSTT